MARKRKANYHKRKEINLEDKYLVNDEITVPTVRLVGDNIEGGSKIVPLEEAQKLADELELDLVLIAPNAEPPVCRILDFQKFIYEEKRKLKEQRSKSEKVEVKEIRFTALTDDHDFNFKVKHAINFLQQGKKVKAYVFFKGRSINYKEKGRHLLDRFLESVKEYGTLETEPKMEGRRMWMIVAPLKGKKHKTKSNAKSEN